MSAISDRYDLLGGARGLLGETMTNETATPDGDGQYRHYQHGSIYWTPATGAHEVYGPIRERWAELRWERGLLGYPISTPYSEVRSRITFLIAQFQHGKMELNSSTQQVYVEKFASASSPNYSTPIVAYRVSDNDGGRPCAITADGVRQLVDHANRVYAAAGILFAYDGALNDLRDTDVNNLPNNNVDTIPTWPATKSRLNTLASNERSVVVLFRFGPGTTSIGGGWSGWDIDFVIMSFFDPHWLGLAHELGHQFGLPHTFGVQFETVRGAADYVLSRGSIEALDADRSLIDDTPPDPYIIQLQSDTAVQAITLGGQAFSFARENIMSYWGKSGPGELSHSQIERVRQLVLERSSRYLSVNVITPVDCAALLSQLASLQSRLQELIAERDAETDPYRRRQLIAAIGKLTNDVTTLTDRARHAGCI